MIFYDYFKMLALFVIKELLKFKTIQNYFTKFPQVALDQIQKNGKTLTNDKKLQEQFFPD